MTRKFHRHKQGESVAVTEDICTIPLAAFDPDSQHQMGEEMRISMHVSMG